MLEASKAPAWAVKSEQAINLRGSMGWMDGWVDAHMWMDGYSHVDGWVLTEGIGKTVDGYSHVDADGYPHAQNTKTRKPRHACAYTK
jgi:hypothetical protein